MIRTIELTTEIADAERDAMAAMNQLSHHIGTAFAIAFYAHSDDLDAQTEAAEHAADHIAHIRELADAQLATIRAHVDGGVSHNPAKARELLVIALTHAQHIARLDTLATTKINTMRRDYGTPW